MIDLRITNWTPRAEIPSRADLKEPVESGSGGPSGEVAYGRFFSRRQPEVAGGSEPSRTKLASSGSWPGVVALALTVKGKTNARHTSSRTGDVRTILFPVGTGDLRLGGLTHPAMERGIRSSIRFRPPTCRFQEGCGTHLLRANPWKPLTKPGPDTENFRFPKSDPKKLRNGPTPGGRRLQTAATNWRFAGKTALAVAASRRLFSLKPELYGRGSCEWVDSQKSGAASPNAWRALKERYKRPSARSSRGGHGTRSVGCKCELMLERNESSSGIPSGKAKPKEHGATSYKLASICTPVSRFALRRSQLYQGCVGPPRPR